MFDGATVKLRRLLHVGCGPEPLPAWGVPVDEVRLDVDPKHQPHFVACMTDMGDVGTYDFVYSCHSLEHLFPHQVGKALREFVRVLNPGGRAIVIVPDLEEAKPTEDVVYDSPAGPVTGLDLFYGMKRLVEINPLMGHHTGFIAATLGQAMRDAGFVSVETRRIHKYTLLAVGTAP